MIVEMEGGKLGQSARTRSAPSGRSDDAARTASRGACGGIPFIAVGSLVEAIHSVEGSVAPAGRRQPDRMRGRRGSTHAGIGLRGEHLARLSR